MAKLGGLTIKRVFRITWVHGTKKMCPYFSIIFYKLNENYILLWNVNV